MSVAYLDVISRPEEEGEEEQEQEQEEGAEKAVGVWAQTRM